jgi:hypothetical protein
MQLKDIISTLMLSDFYFSLPLLERKQEVFRLWALYGAKLPTASQWPYAPTIDPQSYEGHYPKL